MIAVMLVSKFDNLRRKKAFEEGRDLTLRTIAEESDLSLTTINQINGGKVANVHVHTLAKLCAYFQVQSLSELVEYVPDKKD